MSSIQHHPRLDVYTTAFLDVLENTTFDRWNKYLMILECDSIELGFQRKVPNH